MSSEMAIDDPKPPKFVLDEFIAAALSGTPAELHPFFESFRTLYTRKLWHQLTLKLLAFFDEELSRPYRVEVFKSFVRDFETKLNQLKLVELGVKAARELDNPKTQVTFLTSLRDRIDSEKYKDAHVLLLSSIARTKLLFGDLEGTKTDMDEALKVLDDLEGVDIAVNAAYYGVAADYYKAKAEYGPYYRNSLLYLACVDVEKDLSPNERLERAHDLAISAFLADSIYNFGELLMHPILDALDRTPYEWLKKLLFIFNEGHIGKFDALAPVFPQVPILQQNYSFMKQKICLMALIDAAFKRTADNRNMSFQDVAAATQMQYEEVEHLLMKGFSLNLIKGSLDQVDEKVIITWVQPRVLSRDQIGGLASRLDEWVNKLNIVEQRIAPEVAATS